MPGTVGNGMKEALLTSKEKCGREGEEPDAQNFPDKHPERRHQSFMIQAR